MISDEQISFFRLPTINFSFRSAKRKYIITGGPGFGITTVITCLAELKYKTVREAARFIVEREMRRKYSEILPWKNRDRFDIALRDQKIADYESINGKEICFFDRGMPDFVGWRQYLKRSIDDFITAIERHPYERTVFMTQPWEEIYERTEARRLAYTESKSIHDYLTAGYKALGCKIIVLRKTDPYHRAQDILDIIKS